ncbi:MAG: hypothetical protein J6Z22_01585, partial [Lachnospiraceae bacterium]|nr:hypothetical protein [Lachnospiraceae bacterium]
MLPEAFLKRMQEQLGEEYPEFLACYDKPRQQALRLNRLKKTESGESMEEALTALFHMEKVPWTVDGFYYPADVTPGRHPYHEAGLYYIQEPSAMAPVGHLEIKPGERVLDLCAAPGGKSTQIGALLEGRGLLISNEINPSRARILSENVETDLTAANIAWFARQFLACKMENISFRTMPYAAAPSINGISYVSVDQDAWLEMINSCLNPYVEPVTAQNVNLLMSNGSGSNVWSTTGAVAGGPDSFYCTDCT